MPPPPGKRLPPPHPMLPAERQVTNNPRSPARHEFPRRLFPAAPLLRHAQRFTRRLALSHYENFVVGGLLTPRRLRQHFYNIYAYCRIADDLADEIEDDSESLRRLDQWGEWLVGCYEGRPPCHPVFEALQVTIEQFEIPRQPFLALLDAFRQDQRIKCYTTFDQLLEYCCRSANPVGHLVLYLAGCFDAERARAADLVCTGLQLANFWQDVRRDARMGRIYIPLRDIERYQVDPASLADARPQGRVRELLRFQVERTEEFFDAGMPLVDMVPPWLSRDVRLFIGGGRATLRAIRRAEYDVWSQRPTVRRSTQAALMFDAWWACCAAKASWASLVVRGRGRP